jgi:hypothetical protein
MGMSGKASSNMMLEIKTTIARIPISGFFLIMKKAGTTQAMPIANLYLRKVSKPNKNATSKQIERIFIEDFLLLENKLTLRSTTFFVP